MFETGLVFDAKVMTLEGLSLCTIAKDLWYHTFISFASPSDDISQLLKSKNYEDISPTIERVPTAFKNMIDDSVWTAYLEIRYWVESYKNTVLPYYSFKRDSFLRYMEIFVWCWDSTIDYKATARKLLHSDLMTDIQKFQLACLYCLEDEVTRLRSLVWSPLMMHRLQYHSTLIWYWIRYFSQRTVIRNAPLERIIKSSGADNVSAYEYFWDLLNTHAQTRTILLLIRHQARIPFEYLFPKLTKLQWQRIVTETGDELMICLMRNWNKTDEILQIWKYIKDMVRTRQLQTIMRWIWNQNRPCCYIEGQDCLHRFIWTSAPAIKRIYVLKEIERRSEDDDVLDMKLMVQNPILFGTILRSFQHHHRKDFWRSTWSTLIKLFKPEHLRDALNRCFSAPEICKLKPYLKVDCTSVEFYCRKLYKQRDYSYLNVFFDFICWSVTDQIAAFKKHLLVENLKYNWCHTYEHLEDFHSLDEFIQSAFEQSKIISSYKYLFTLAISNLELYPNFFQDGRFKLVKNFVESFVHSDILLQAIKERFVDSFQSRLVAGHIFGVFEHNDLDEFLVWCLGSEISLTVFVKSLPLAKIRKVALQRFLSSESTNSPQTDYDIFSHESDAFLEWYTAKTTEPKEVKRVSTSNSENEPYQGKRRRMRLWQKEKKDEAPNF